MTEPLDLDPIAAREAAATEGPWWNDSHEIYAGPTNDTLNSRWIGETCRVLDEAGSDADGAFIAHARQDVPALLAEVRRLRAELDRRDLAIAEIRGSIGRLYIGDENQSTPHECGEDALDAIAPGLAARPEDESCGCVTRVHPGHYPTCPTRTAPAVPSAG